MIIAYRGTDPGLFAGQAKEHGLTTIQDVAVDATMVRDRVNPQKAAADAFTQEMIDKAAQLGISKGQVFVAGHSLGGTLAEIEAAKYGLHGMTFNAYGAADLIDGPIQPGCQLANYRMAGDVVSAASEHIGTVVPLASEADVESMRSGRYLDPPSNAEPPNPFLSMRLGDHGVGNLAGPSGLLSHPKDLAEAMQRYADNKAAFDRYRSDVNRERGELGLALHQMENHVPGPFLPPALQHQLNEYLAMDADPAVQKMVEQNTIVQGTENALQQGANGMSKAGHFVQTQDERLANVARAAGGYAAPLSPFAPLAGAAVAEAAHLQGEAANAIGEFAASSFQTMKEAVEHGSHGISQAVKDKIHDPALQAAGVGALNHVIDAYRNAEDLIHHTEQKYEAAKQSVSRGIEGAEHAVGNAVETLAHPSGWFQSEAPPTRHESPVHAPHPQSITPAEQGYSRSDPRHPDSPQHALYQELKERIPAAGEHRLVQFTAVCHSHHITAQNLDKVGLNHQEGTAIFTGTGAHVAVVDVKQPSPDPAQSIRQIQQFDQQQAHTQAIVQNAIAQSNAQAQAHVQHASVMSGPSPGGFGY